MFWVLLNVLVKAIICSRIIQTSNYYLWHIHTIKYQNVVIVSWFYSLPVSDTHIKSPLYFPWKTSTHIRVFSSKSWFRKFSIGNCISYNFVSFKRLYYERLCIMRISWITFHTIDTLGIFRSTTNNYIVKFI